MAKDLKPASRGVLDREISRRSALQLFGATAVTAVGITTLAAPVGARSRGVAAGAGRAFQQAAPTGTIRLGSYEGGFGWR